MSSFPDVRGSVSSFAVNCSTRSTRSISASRIRLPVQPALDESPTLTMDGSDNSSRKSCGRRQWAMTRLLTFVMAAATGALLVAADPVDGVREAAAGWRQGAVKQDKALLQRYLSDDLVYEHGGGKTQTKAEYIADVTTGPSHYVSFQESEVNIRVYGKTAVLTGFVDVKPA